VSLFEIAKLENELQELEEQTTMQDFWNDSNNSSIVLKKINALKTKTENFKKINNSLTDTIELNEILKQETDESLENELITTIKNLEKSIEKLEINTLLSGKFDSNNAIITLHPGAGGTESCDWVQMLYRMYTRWALDNGYEVKELDYLDGEEAGIKSVTALVSGAYAYGYLKGEMGVHRLVRISPFDSGGRRHTSFASLEVLPEITEEIEIDINPDDLRVDTYRASGAGGQHINKTSSAVRITHIPTNTVVSCQSERSQIQNRETAMKMLKSKLLDMKEKEHKDKIEDLKGTQMDIAWGSQIRSYVFCPYTMVKDHRTGYEVGNVQGVMDGDINDFIDSYLKWNKTQNSLD
jgi:peptide chain release factor 2